MVVVVAFLDWIFKCMHSEDSYAAKARTVYGLRRHARGRFGIIHYRYTHYLVRLREGRPPQHYFPPRPTGNEMLQEYLERLRQRRIYHSLWVLLSVKCIHIHASMYQACMAVPVDSYFLLAVTNLIMCSGWNNCILLSVGIVHWCDSYSNCCNA